MVIILDDAHEDLVYKDEFTSTNSISTPANEKLPIDTCYIDYQKHCDEQYLNKPRIKILFNR